MLNIRHVFRKIIVCPLNSHLCKGANVYNNVLLLGDRLVFIPKIIFIIPVIAEIIKISKSMRFPSPLALNARYCRIQTATTEIRGKRTFLLIAWSDNTLESILSGFKLKSGVGILGGSHEVN